MILVGILLAHPVWADRVALVIGNANYDHEAHLPNTLNDVSDIGDALDRLGFKVTRLENASRQEMESGLLAFGDVASGAELAVLFYAGHGIEVGGKNYLIPVDAKLQTDKAINFQTVPLDVVVSMFGKVEGLGLVILDACRENPFVGKMEKSDPTRAIGRGLARVVPSGPNMVIAYAATEGMVASDGKGQNSPYTTALLSHLEDPGLEFNYLFPKVAASVRQSTNGDQIPVTYGNFPPKKIFLAGRPAHAEEQSSPTQPNSDTKLKADVLFWEDIKDSDDPSDFEDYLRQFPNSEYTTRAKRKQIIARGAPRGRELFSDYGDKAMLYAARENAVDALEWLKAQGVGTNARDNYGDTPMHWAACGNAVEAMEWLDALGASVSALNKGGATPMHRAARQNAVDAMKWLKAQGADVNARDNNGKTPMQYAASKDSVDAVKWLKAQGGGTGKIPKPFWNYIPVSSLNPNCPSNPR